MQISVSKSKALVPWAQTEFDTVDVRTREQLNHIVTAAPWSPIVWNPARRRSENFSSARLCVLDFDTGSPTLSEALEQAYARALWFVMGTTKSHQKQKNDTPPVDRFRLIMRFDQTLTDAAHYTQNMKRIIKEWGADPAAADGARWFSPCREIVGFDTGSPVATLPYRPPPRNFNKHEYMWSEKRHVPDWIKNVLTQGVACGERNSTIYRVCKSLQKFGWTHDDALMLIGKTNILPERELTSVIKSAYRTR